MQHYAKAVVAIIGVGITTTLGLISPDTDLFTVLTIVSAMLTAVGVYVVPNTPAVDGRYEAAGDDPNQHRS